MIIFMIMEEPFVLIVEHNGKEHSLETQFMPMGYTHKFKVIVEELEVLFEPDEEGEYRAVLPVGIDEKTKRRIDMTLLQNIAVTLKEALA
jgi:hypothetical protein